MESAAEFVQNGAIVAAPLIVALLCLYARHRRIGGDDLLLWAAGHLALALALLLASVAPARGELAQLGFAWRAALFFHTASVWLLLFGVLALQDRRITALRGVLAAAVIATVFAAIVSVVPALYVDTGLLASAAVILVAAGILILRRRSAVYVIAGLILVLRAANNLFFALEVQQAGAFLLPHQIATLSVFFNFLSGMALLAIAVENAWMRLGAALAEARDARQEADTILDLAPVSIVRKDADLRLVKVNRYFEELADRIGADHGPLVGTRRDEVLPRDAVMQMEALDRQALANPELGTIEREIVFEAANGSIVTMLVRKSATLGEGGIPTGVISVALDITRLKEIEKELRHQVAIAEKASRAKSDFLAHMSHELRTPLNGIGGYAEMLAAGYFGELSPKQKEYLDHILEASRRMLALVTRILELSQLDAGRMVLNKTALDIGAAMRNAIDAASGLAASRQVMLDVSAEAVTVDVDPAAMDRVFSSLLSNAIKFGPAGGRVQVCVRREGEQAVVEVKDAGGGMSAEQIAALGDLFLRGDPLKARPGGGSGLGLAISRGLVELHGGTLGIVSGPEIGTVVTLRL